MLMERNVFMKLVQTQPKEFVKLQTELLSILLEHIQNMEVSVAAEIDDRELAEERIAELKDGISGVVAALEKPKYKKASIIKSLNELNHKTPVYSNSDGRVVSEEVHIPGPDALRKLAEFGKIKAKAVSPSDLVTGTKD